MSIEPIDVQILNAVMTQLTVPALYGSPLIASPGVAFTPVAGTSYLEAHGPLRAQPEQFGITIGNAAIHSGVFQVDAVVPNQKGEAAGLRLASLVADRFAFGTRLALETAFLKIIAKPAIASKIVDGIWNRFPVSITYQVIV